MASSPSPHDINFCVLSLEGAKASALVSDVLNATLGLVRMPQSPGSLGQSSRCTRHRWVKGKMHATLRLRVSVWGMFARINTVPVPALVHPVYCSTRKSNGETREGALTVDEWASGNEGERLSMQSRVAQHLTIHAKQAHTNVQQRLYHSLAFP